jgi:two-component system, LytTR family, response regulator
MLKVLIVDDEFKCREVLKVMLQESGIEINIVGTAEDVPSALDELHKHAPDLVFLDVELEQETGFDFLKQASPINFEVVFTTAYTHYAINAIKFSAIDYLLKPINPEELMNAIQKVIEKKNASTFKNKIDVLFQNLKGPGNRQKIALPTTEGLIFVQVEDIVFCEADGAYTAIHLKSAGKIFVSKNLKEYETLLTDCDFFRVHNSFLVNLNEVKRYVKGEGGYVIMSNNLKVDVAKRKKDGFLAKIPKG